MTPDALKFNVQLIGTVSLNGMAVEAAKEVLVSHLQEYLDGFSIAGVGKLLLCESSEVAQVHEYDRVSWVHDVEVVALCERHKVRLVQAEEPELQGRWKWIADNDNASVRTLESKGEAARDAIRALCLLDK